MGQQNPTYGHRCLWPYRQKTLLLPMVLMLAPSHICLQRAPPCPVLVRQWLPGVSRDATCHLCVTESPQYHLAVPPAHQDEPPTLTVRFDPPPDGSCQFAAMADQLSTVGIFCSGASLREEIVADLRRHPHTGDGTLLSHYVEDNDWEAYLRRMAQQGTYGDHITLQRAAQMFRVQFLVVSSLGPEATSVIRPTRGFCTRSPLLALGHMAEGHGEHYVSLEGPVHRYMEAILRAKSQKVLLRRRDDEGAEH